MLGSLFFVIYVNDVMVAVRNTHLQLYADDTVLVAQGNTADEAIRQLQPVLIQFSTWCHQNKLSLNAKYLVQLGKGLPKMT